MFYRGQKVIITASTVKDRMHPAVGDTGYIENMFLFPNEHLILMSLIMCSYKKNDARSEHKKFILDLGIHPSVRDKLKSGVNKLFFLSKNSVNLLPAFMYRNKIKVTNGNKYDYMVPFPQIVGTYGIWTGYTRKEVKNNVQSDKPVIIPIGHIKACTDKCAIHTLPVMEIKSWVRSVLPNIVAATTLYPLLNNNDCGDLKQRINGLFHTFKNSLISNERLDGINLYNIKPTILEHMKRWQEPVIVPPIIKLNAIVHTAYTKLFKKVVNTITQTESSITINNFLSMNDVVGLIDVKTAIKQSIRVADAAIIGDGLYRAILINRETKPYLECMRECLPKDWNIDGISNLADDIKSHVNDGSAALYRLLDIINSIYRSTYRGFERRDEYDIPMVVENKPRTKINKIDYNKLAKGLLKRMNNGQITISDLPDNMETVMTYERRD